MKVQSSPLSTQPKYSLQSGIHRRTESAILSATKDLIAQHGACNISMIEISDAAQVSRATLYNHYRDKNAVLAALIESEVERLVSECASAATPAQILEHLSLAISSDHALASMRVHDQDLLVAILTHSENPLYLILAERLFDSLRSEAGTGVAMRWLLGQVMQPLNKQQSHDQAVLLANL